MNIIKTENIKVNKFWLSKDKFISRFDAEKGPNHWYLKKFIVLLIPLYILVVGDQPSFLIFFMEIFG